MKTRKLTLALAALLLTSAAFVSSCRKKATEEKDTDTSSASDNNLAETTSNDVVNMAGQASEHGALSSYRLGTPNDVTALSCADTVKIDTTAKLIRVHFGNTTCLDGRTRSGVLLFDYSGSTAGAKWYRNPGYKVHVTSQNYVVDNNAVTIDKTITNTGFNSSNNLTWSINSSVTIVRSGGAGTITWNASRTKTLLNTSAAFTIGGSSCAPCYTNQATPIDWSTAVIGINGSASGVSAKGVGYSLNVNNIIRNMNCSPAGHPFRRPFVQGSIDFTPSGKATRHVDFGNGTCDIQFTVTINGTTYGPYDLP